MSWSICLGKKDLAFRINALNTVELTMLNMMEVLISKDKGQIMVKNASILSNLYCKVRVFNVKKDIKLFFTT